MIAEKWSDDTAIYYVYNANGIAGFVYNGTPYVYQKNIFGDVVAIYDNTGTKVAGYRYNAFGENFIYYQVGSIGELNPFRYRGYYYDSETGLYYLQSRYYDPAMGRFLNADTIDYLDPKVINGINLYAYALNNPVQYCDPTGHAWILSSIIGGIIGGIIGAISELVVDIVDGNGLDHSRNDYLGSTVSGAISGLGVGLGASTLLSGIGEAVGGWIRGDVNNIQQAGEMFIQGAASALAFGSLAKGLRWSSATGRYQQIIGLNTNAGKKGQALAKAGYVGAQVTKKGENSVIRRIYNEAKFKKLEDNLNRFFGFANNLINGLS